MQITTERFMLVFTDRTTKEIGLTEKNNIMNAIKVGKDFVAIEGSLYRVWTLGEIITLGEYYDRHPDKRPNVDGYDFKDFSAGNFKPKNCKQSNIVKQLMKGLKDYIDGDQNAGTGETEKLMKKFADRLVVLEKQGL
jgi:hypothetical protein